MSKKYLISTKRVKLAISFLVGLSLFIGYVTGTGMAKMTPRTEEDIINSAMEIKEFIEREVDKNKDLKEIEKEAKLLGKKKGLTVVFVDGNYYNTTKVNIILSLGNKSPIISSFEI